MTSLSPDAEILQGVQRRIQFWSKRNDAIKNAYKMREMKSDEQTASLVVPDARKGFELAVHMLSRKTPIHRIPRGAQDEAQAKLNSITERLLHHLWRLNDEYLFLQGREWFTRILSDWCLGCGFYAIQWGVYADANEQPIFIADPLDPTTVYPEYGSLFEGLVACDRVYQTTLDIIRRQAVALGWNASNLNGSGTVKVTVTDHWEQRKSLLSKDNEVLHAVYVNNQPVLSLTKEDLLVIPILAGPVGGMQTASNYYTNPEEAAARWGQHILVASSALYEIRNRVWEMTLEDLRQAIARTIIDYSLGRKGVVSPGDEGKIVHADVNEKVEELMRQTFTSNFALTHQGLEQMQQRALFPWTMFGQAPFDVSGVALEQLNSAAITILGPTQIAMQRLMRQVDLYWLQEYKRRWKDTNTPLEATGIFQNKTYDLRISPAELPDKPWVEVKAPMDLPADMLNKLNASRIAKPVGNLVDDEYILDEIMDVFDPQLMQERIAADEATQHPAFKAAQVLKKFTSLIADAIRRGDKLEEQLYREAFTQFLNAFSGAAVQGQGIPAEPGVNPAVKAPFYNRGRPKGRETIKEPTLPAPEPNQSKGRLRQRNE